MATIQLDRPAQIEKQFQETWRAAENVDEIKASLFNLIVFVPDPARVPYALRTCHLVTHTYPCRVILLTQDTQADQDYLTTEVSVDLIGDGSHRVSCDQIEFRYSGDEGRKVPFLILPHLVPDLPVYLLWLGHPKGNQELFNFLQPITSRVIFDPDFADLLPQFSRMLLDVLSQSAVGISDLHWASTENWRQAIASVMNSSERLDQLSQLKRLTINYGYHESAFPREGQMPAYYLQGWLASQMGWEFETLQREEDKSHIVYTGLHGPLEVHLVGQSRPDLEFGTILSLEGESYDEWRFEFLKDRTGQMVRFRLWTPERCEIPFTLYLPHPQRERVLARELFDGGTSSHYQKMLKVLAGIEQRSAT